MKTNSKGFTLIELLIVIAIIGILAAVVLASLNTARAKGADATIKEDFAGIRTEADIFYDDNGQNYGTDVTDGDCTTAGSVFGESHIANAITHAQTVSNATAACYSDDGDPAAGTGASSWAVSISLKSDPTQMWCITNDGIAAVYTTGAGLDLVSSLAICQ